MLLLSPRNTQCLPDTAASTLLRLLKPSFFREHLGCIMQIFPHCDVDMWGHVWMSRFRGGAWQNLNFDKEYLFCFETLVFATSGILSTFMQLADAFTQKQLTAHPGYTFESYFCMWSNEVWDRSMYVALQQVGWEQVCLCSRSCFLKKKNHMKAYITYFSL